MSLGVSSAAKNFISWIKVKIKLHTREGKVVLFREREIWWASVGMNIGSEQHGKNKTFERPVLILRKFSKHLFLGIPLTTKQKNNRYYLRCVYRKYWRKNGKLCYRKQYGVLVLSQVRAMSPRRLIRKSGIVAKKDIVRIKKKVCNLL